MTEQTISVELTQEQFNHVRTILAQAKPSRTRLSQEEKHTICTILKNIINELSCISIDYEFREPTQNEIEDYQLAQNDIKTYNTIIKKLK